jgi:hypothetical protein
MTPAFDKLDIFGMALFSGLALATKVSSMLMVIFPLVILVWFLLVNSGGRLIYRLFRGLIIITSFFVLTTIVAIVFSPHNLLSIEEFLGTLNYEAAVAMGKIKVFYTGQFDCTIPVLFQLFKILPFTLGWPTYLLSIAGFFGLSWKDSAINLLRIAFVVFFLPTVVLYAKWTRFIAPIFPILTIFSVIFIYKVHYHIFQSVDRAFKRKRSELSLRRKERWHLLINTIVIILTVVSAIPGIAYLSIYRNPDVRFIASKWIYDNIQNGSYLLSETANVVDIPLEVPDRQQTPANYQTIAYNFYELDINPAVQDELNNQLSLANNILVPSRRIFYNHTCIYGNDTEIVRGINQIGYSADRCGSLSRRYPQLNQYYRNLFSGNSGFRKVVEISSYPRIELFGRKIFELPDEDAEETWTVFDHPVVRVFKKNE